jgi:hypothetical protein
MLIFFSARLKPKFKQFLVHLKIRTCLSFESISCYKDNQVNKIVKSVIASIVILCFKIFIRSIKKYKRKNSSKENNLKILSHLSPKLISFLKKLWKIVREINFGP